jgi:hypothetical protein
LPSRPYGLQRGLAARDSALGRPPSAPFLPGCAGWVGRLRRPLCRPCLHAPAGLQRGFAARGRPLPTGGQGRLRLPRRSALPPPGLTSSDGAEDLRERGDTPLPSHREGAGLRPLRFGAPDSASPRKWAIQSVGPPPGPPPWTRGCAPEQRQRPPDSAAPRRWASPGASVPRPGGSPGLARPAEATRIHPSACHMLHAHAAFSMRIQHAACCMLYASGLPPLPVGGLQAPIPVWGEPVASRLVD